MLPVNLGGYGCAEFKNLILRESRIGKAVVHVKMIFLVIFLLSIIKRISLSATRTDFLCSNNIVNPL